MAIIVSLELGVALGRALLLVTLHGRRRPGTHRPPDLSNEARLAIKRRLGAPLMWTPHASADVLAQSVCDRIS